MNLGLLAEFLGGQVIAGKVRAPGPERPPLAMVALEALTLAVCAVAGFARAALRGSPSALAVGVVDAAAAALCWLAGRIVA